MDLNRKKLLVGAVVILLLIVLLVFLVDWEEIYDQLHQANWFFMSLASFALLAGYIVYALRWRFLLDNEAKFLSTFHATNVGNLLNAILPIRPGEPVRIAILSARDDIPFARVTSSFIVDRWLEQLMRLASFLGAVFFGAGLAVSPEMILGLLIFVLALFGLISWVLKRRDELIARLPPFFARLPRLQEDSIRRALLNLIDGFNSFSSPVHLASAVTWSLIIWFLFWVFHYMVLVALGSDVQFGISLALSLGSLALVPPSSTTMPGIYHASMILPLSLLVYNHEALTTYAILMNALLMIWVIILGLWGIMRAGFSVRKYFNLN